MDQILIFANPVSGRGRGLAVARLLQSHLTTKGYNVTLFLDKASSVNFQPGNQPIRAAIVVGGDGTLRAVAQWAVDLYLAHREIPFPLLIVPMGTANVMGTHLGIAWNHDHLQEEVEVAISGGRIVRLDAARTRGGIFLLMAGVGFDAWVVQELARIRRGPITLASYVLPTIRALQEYKFPAIEITIDGKCVFPKAPGLAIIGNIPEYALGLNILPHARSDDGLLDACIMPCANWHQMARLCLACAAGSEHVAEEGVIYAKGKHIHVESDAPVPIQVDGEPDGFTPIDIDLLPLRIPFLLPVR